MSSAQLIQTQTAAPGQSVSVWREVAEDGSGSGLVYRKVWQSQQAGAGKAWLSWAHHEHFVLTLLAHAEARHVVQVAGLQVHPQRVEVVTHDAGPDFRRDWLSRVTAPMLLARPQDLLKLARACLRALQAVHALGVVHGDFKADNVCIHAQMAGPGGPMCLDLTRLRLIDFAYAVYRERPLKFVLPTDPQRLDYLPDFYRQAIRQAQTQGDPGPIQRAACAQVDLFSLWCMLRELAPDTSTSQWSAWHDWLQACHQASAEPVSATHPLEQPTTQLLALTESLLVRLHEPSAQWDEAATTLSASDPVAAATPVLQAQATPLLTPLVLTVQPLVLQEVSAVPVPALVASGGADGHRWRARRIGLKALALVALACVFAFVDRRFEQTGTVLSDAGFFLGLLAMAMAPLLLAASAWHALAPSRPASLWARSPAWGLCGIAAYYLVALFPQGVSAMALGLGLLLLMLLAWAWRR